MRRLGLIAVFLVWYIGCSRDECEALPPIQLPEVIGGTVHRVVMEKLGVDLAASTPPGFCPLYVAPMAAADRCLVEHELVHVEQADTLTWPVYSVLYAASLKGCWLAMGLHWMAFLPCYLQVPFEVTARAAQDRCSGGGP